MPATGRSYDLVIRDAIRHGEHEAVVVDRGPGAAADGVFNVWLEDGGWAQLGAVVDEGPGTVTRIVLGAKPVDGLRAGQRASWSGVYYEGPGDAGHEAEEVSIPTTAGPTPAWVVRSAEGEGSRWAIHIHGLGSRRAGTLRGVDAATRRRLTSLVVSYRNDREGPVTGSGRPTLGATETDDVRAALRYALDCGARSFTLFGWSMGAAIALQLAADAEFRSLVDALVLDSPVIDWNATINANCARAGLPSWFGVFAQPWLRVGALARLAGLEASVPLDRFDWIHRADELSVPILILHGVRDSSVPFALSARLAELRPDLVRLERFDSEHTMTWNSDRERWQRAVVEWLDSLGVSG
ncbi:alpha/beta fold hydrolase [Microbacterium sp. BK668]|uniref:alpha/beta hydrolase n=1 Tax=Microbacterium sp. BK668 TaxID=2512118 RepID=UPI001FB7BE24|nr:alpha/beta fold hydrolase [Microbacterium sp. BK668]